MLYHKPSTATTIAPSEYRFSVPPVPSLEFWKVGFESGDPRYPQNWTLKRRWKNCLIYLYNTVVLAAGSSTFGAVNKYVVVEFETPEYVALLGVSLFIMGWAIAPCVFGPLSGLFGRFKPAVVSITGMTLCFFITASAANIQVVLISRFLGGIFGSGLLVLGPSSYADMFDATMRGTVMSIVITIQASTPIVAPTLSTVVGENLGWRWTEYMLGIVSFVGLAIYIAFVKETVPEVILNKRAVELRSQTGNWAIHSEGEKRNLTMKNILTTYIIEPSRMYVTEFIFFAMVTYQAFVFGTMYLFSGSVPTVYRVYYGMGFATSTLALLAMGGGSILAMIVMVSVFEPRYRQIITGCDKPMPHKRLTSLAIGGVIYPCGIFGFAWTAQYQLHWIVPTLFTVPIGAGISFIFVTCINYLVDKYTDRAASALACAAMVRSFTGACFVILGHFLFTSLPVGSAGTIVGAIAMLLAPIPFLFMRYGDRESTS